jgi:hypothetical protein
MLRGDSPIAKDGNLPVVLPQVDNSLSNLLKIYPITRENQIEFASAATEIGTKNNYFAF